MLTRLITCLCIGIIIHADSSISTSAATSANVSPAHEPQTTPPPFVIDDELTKIAASCITNLEHEQLSGNSIRHIYVVAFNNHLIKEATNLIASMEMRAALGFAPPGPWTHYKEPSADELASALTVEEYFDLRDRFEDRSLDSFYFFEKNFPPVIAFLDKRFPAIRTIYKRKFQEILSDNLGGKIDRKTVDYIIYNYIYKIHPKVSNAIQQMLRQKSKYC
ncbi:hypothetical protein CRE_21135 [Caenorhabditis remanei]|uniref:Uncharacterized protein n=1 Tax=Caenorhabditis remanei TaxID=31234 RepID=E3MEX6_CAERE|nr:hypothetical protein CRE_21135 [Caenorhabditis remanei]